MRQDPQLFGSPPINPSPALIPFSGIRDNHRRGTVAEFLREKIAPGSELSFVSTYFTIYGYAALAPQLEQAKGLRFLFGEPKFVSNLDPEKTDKKEFRIEDQEITLGNRLSQKPIAKECAAWIKERVDIRSVKQTQLLHGKLYHIQDDRVASAIVGSSNFTVKGLGDTEKPNVELNIVVDGDRDRQDVLLWFNELWNDASLVEDVKDEVLRYLEQVYVDHSPEFIYFKTLYHLFERYLNNREEEKQTFDQVEIIDTQIWNALFEFQRDGVKGAIGKINAHNGCILADSVGLGKTFTALAIIKYYELRNHRVLVLCPKKLRDNWTIYPINNSSELNPFPRDKFNFTVLSHTDLSRESGRTGDIDLANINWQNYDLVVIDESHNFRNNTKGKKDEEGNTIRKSRYERLMQDIIQAGVKTKVLLLSATPVNNDLDDLRNQVYFITQGRDTSFAETFSIASINETLRTSQKTFTDWAKVQGEKDTKTLLQRLPAGFFTLLDELTIARSRKHIRRYYASSLAELGDFPKRGKPQAIYSEIDSAKEFMSYDKLNDEISDYGLYLYKPFEHVRDEYKYLYERQVGNFKQSDRENFLVGIMKVNFLKRLESSVASFAITMDRTVTKIERLERRLKTYLASQGDPEYVADFSDELDPEDEDTAHAFEVGKAMKYKMEHIDVDAWLTDLADDRKKLSRLREQAIAVTPERDLKFAELRALIKEKVTHGTPNQDGEVIRKVIVFTAFADTAAYLYENLRDWVKNELDANIALVSGGAKACQTTFGKPEYGQILTNFSPRAKNRAKMRGMDHSSEIDVLIATDCISEGQNLQDCDLIINYDIHWNPVRIIQRFGRIDRIGSLHNKINLINFWPTPDLNKYINLKNRVEARMALVDISATAEDNLLDAKDIEDLIKDDLKYRDKQLLRLKEEILDLEDFNETISISEFSLDDFRAELANYIEDNKRALRDAPFGLYTVVPATEHLWIRPGAIFCLKQVGDTDGTEIINPIQPYYLVYVHETGDVRLSFGQPKQILELLRDLCIGRATAYKELCELFDQETNDGKDMERYTHLLQRSVATIAEQVSKKSLGNLLGGRGGKLINSAKRAKDVDDFELITWLILKGED